MKHIIHTNPPSAVHSSCHRVEPTHRHPLPQPKTADDASLLDSNSRTLQQPTLLKAKDGQGQLPACAPLLALCYTVCCTRSCFMQPG